MGRRTCVATGLIPILTIAQMQEILRCLTGIATGAKELLQFRDVYFVQMWPLISLALGSA